MPHPDDPGGSSTVTTVTDEDGRVVTEDSQEIASGGTPSVTVGPLAYGPDPA